MDLQIPRERMIKLCVAFPFSKHHGHHIVLDLEGRERWNNIPSHNRQ